MPDLKSVDRHSQYLFGQYLGGSASQASLGFYALTWMFFRK